MIKFDFRFMRFRC